MTSEIPLGEVESQRLEFKAAAALSRPETIGREVVAMLNADGGEVWVGLREEDGRAVGVDAIEDVERVGASLHDSLIDTISPPPTGAEVQVATVPDAAGGGILKIVVSPDTDKRPYALVRAGGWQFPSRVGSRIRPLERDEIRQKFMSGGGGRRDDDRLAQVKEMIRERLDATRAQAGETFVMTAEPTSSKALDLVALRDSGYLSDPTHLGDRRFGHSVANAAWLGNEQLVPSAHRVRIGREGIFYLDVFRSGGVLFHAPLMSFFRPGPPHSAPEKTLFPIALVEYPTSVFRLLARLYSDASLWESGPPDRSTRVLATVAAFGIGGWTLRPRSPQDWSSFDLPSPRSFSDADLVLPEPIMLTVSDSIASPDASARRLWSRIYEAFGFWPEDHPREFDRSTGRLSA